MSGQTWLIALVFGASTAFIVGMVYGRSLERDDWTKLIRRADLPASCEQKLRGASDELNFEAEEWGRVGPERRQYGTALVWRYMPFRPARRRR
jgi:hypothetical protein